MIRALVLVLLVLMPVPATAQRETATQLLDRSIARMGGDSALRSVRTLRLDMLTQWLRTTFAERPFADLPSYERNVELRDYGTASWRNTRYFSPTAPTPGVVDVVRDTVAARLMPRAQGAAPTWGPLNVAYVDERRELFAFAPERLVLALRADPAVRTLADTTLDGVTHARLAATVDGWPAVVHFRRDDALPTMVRFRADETNDFGLAPWGEHEVEFWYSGWFRHASGVVLPRQRDVQRVGRPYKRMTLLATSVNAEAPADSFAVSDSVATAFLASERRPMWRMDLEGVARLEREGMVTFPPMVGSFGAVLVGGRWLVLESGQAVGAMELAAAWLGRHGGGAPVGGAVATNPGTGNGGAPWFVSRRLPLFGAPGAMATLVKVTGSRAGITAIATPRWVRFGTDSLWMEPLNVPDMQGTMAVYSPTLRWLWMPFTGSPLHAPEQAAVIAGLERRGLPVAWLGGPRGTVARPSP